MLGISGGHADWSKQPESTYILKCIINFSGTSRQDGASNTKFKLNKLYLHYHYNFTVTITS